MPPGGAGSQGEERHDHYHEEREDHGDAPQVVDGAAEFFGGFFTGAAHAPIVRSGGGCALEYRYSIRTGGVLVPS